MRATLLAELSDLFALEALEADKGGDPDEAERLWDISAELLERCVATHHREFVGVP